MTASRLSAVAMLAVICGVSLCALGVLPAEAQEQKSEAGTAFNRKDCKRLFDSAPAFCVLNGRADCGAAFGKNVPSFRITDFEKNPRWQVAEERMSNMCQKLCAIGKRPPYSGFAKSICGPYSGINGDSRIKDPDNIQTGLYPSR